MFSIADLPVPLLVAPMAGGISTPELVNAVGAAGGMAFLASGYLSAAELSQQLDAVAVPNFGVNLFVPGENPGALAQRELETYRRQLKVAAAVFNVEVGEPIWSDDDWHNKIDLLLSRPVPVVSFTFGNPPKSVVEALHKVGSSVYVTVKSADEALAALSHGADALIAQGHEAGGHHSSFTLADPPRTRLYALLDEVLRVVDRPVIAAGGIGDHVDVTHVLRAGAAACQLGTAFLLAEEAGTSLPYRRAIVDPNFSETCITRGFSGRVGRALSNAFTRQYGGLPYYPQVNAMTRPIRAAAAREGDSDYLSLWAGTSWQKAFSAPAATILSWLWLPTQEHCPETDPL